MILLKRCANYTAIPLKNVMSISARLVKVVDRKHKEVICDLQKHTSPQTMATVQDDKQLVASSLSLLKALGMCNLSD